MRLGLFQAEGAEKGLSRIYPEAAPGKYRRDLPGILCGEGYTIKLILNY